jgi:hypothetical protein
VQLFTVFNNRTTTREEIENYNYASPPPNRPHDEMKNTIWRHLQQYPFIKESGRMFSVYK